MALMERESLSSQCQECEYKIRMHICVLKLYLHWTQNKILTNQTAESESSICSCSWKKSSSLLGSSFSPNWNGSFQEQKVQFGFCMQN